MTPSRSTVFLLLGLGLMMLICCIWTNFLSILGEAFSSFIQISIFHDIALSMIKNTAMSLTLGFVSSLVVYSSLIHVSPKSTKPKHLKLPNPRQDNKGIMDSLFRSIQWFPPAKFLIDCFPVVSRDSSTGFVRLASFSDVEVELPVSTALLALNGFYFSRAENHIICCWCSTTMSLDELRTGGSPPAHGHRCRSLRQRTDGENYRETLGMISDNSQTESSPDSPVCPGEFALTMKLTEPSTSNSTDFSSVARRIASFENHPWALGDHSPDKLASNGLYHAGIGDKVCCHGCTFVIENWIDPALSSTDAARPNLLQLHQQHDRHTQQQPGGQDRAPCPFVERSLTGQAFTG